MDVFRGIGHLVLQDDILRGFMPSLKIRRTKGVNRTVQTPRQMQDEFEHFLNVLLKDREWRRALSDIKVGVYATDLFCHPKEGYYIILLNLVGKKVPMHSRIEILIEEGQIAGFPIFDFSEEAQDFLRLYSTPVMRDLLVMLNRSHKQRTGSDISLFETGIRRGIRSVIFFRKFFKGFGAYPRCLKMPKREVFRKVSVMGFISVVTKKDFWLRLDRDASIV